MTGPSEAPDGTESRNGSTVARTAGGAAGDERGAGGTKDTEEAERELTAIERPK